MNEVPMYLFIILTLLAFVAMLISLKIRYPINIVTGIIAIMLSYFLSRTSINGKLVQSYGGMTSTDTVTTGTLIIQNSAMGWIFLFMAIVCLGILIKMAMDELTYQMKPILEAR